MSEEQARRPKQTRTLNDALKSMIREVDASEYVRSAKSELEKLYYGHEGRRAHKWHHYLEVYDRHLGRFLAQRREGGQGGNIVRLLEIGVGGGGSLELWRKYLGINSVVFGIDIDPRRAIAAETDVKVRIGSQADPAFLQSVVGEMGGIDIVIDDGSHVASHQRASFETLFPILSADGIYICEDLHTSYGSRFEGGLRRPGTFIELTKSMIDWLHVRYTLESEPVDPMGFSEKVFGIHIYDSMVVIEKRVKEAPFHTRVGHGDRSTTEA